MQVLTVCCWVTLGWMVVGYSLAWAPAYPNNHMQEVYGNADRLWLRGMTLRTFHYAAPTIPESVFCGYHLAYAMFTAALVCGSLAERMNYVPMTVFVALWHLAVYCPLVHSVWHPQGFLKYLGALDYAGGNVVHISAGMSNLAISCIVGRRKRFGTHRFRAQNVQVTFIGLCILWVGWFGLTAGSSHGANFNTGYAMFATQLSAGVGAIMWWLTEYAHLGGGTAFGLLSGAFAGLVCITPAAGYVDFTGAFFVGFFGAPACYGGTYLLSWFGVDDPLDAFSVHAVGGIVGGIATGFWAIDDVIGTPQVL